MAPGLNDAQAASKHKTGKHAQSYKHSNLSSKEKHPCHASFKQALRKTKHNKRSHKNERLKTKNSQARNKRAHIQKSARHQSSRSRLLARHLQRQEKIKSALYLERSIYTQNWPAQDNIEQEPPVGQPDENLVEGILASAQSYIGTPYRFGGTSGVEGFDCSGFVQHVYSANGVRLKRSSNEQGLQGKHVALNAIRPGDLIFFDMQNRKPRRINHVGVYMGDGRFIHASSSRTGRVQVEDLDTKNYRQRIITTRRIIEKANAKQNLNDEFMPHAIQH